MVDYALVLADLRAKRVKLKVSLDETDAAIRSLERLFPDTQMSEFVVASHQKVPEQSETIPLLDTGFAKLSIYDAACQILSDAGHPLESAELIEMMRKGGKAVKKDSTTVLYRYMTEKPDSCQITRVGEGRHSKWALKEWNL